MGVRRKKIILPYPVSCYLCPLHPWSPNFCHLPFPSFLMPPALLFAPGGFISSCFNLSSPLAPCLKSAAQIPSSFRVSCLLSQCLYLLFICPSLVVNEKSILVLISFLSSSRICSYNLGPPKKKGYRCRYCHGRTLPNGHTAIWRETCCTVLRTRLHHNLTRIPVLQTSPSGSISVQSAGRIRVYSEPRLKLGIHSKVESMHSRLI